MPPDDSEPPPASFANRCHFFVAARATGRILIERAPARRGGGRKRVHADLDAGSPAEDLLALEDAFDQLAARDPQKAMPTPPRTSIASLRTCPRSNCRNPAPRAIFRFYFEGLENTY